MRWQGFVYGKNSNSVMIPAMASILESYGRLGKRYLCEACN